MSLSQEQMQLIEDSLRLDIILHLLRGIDCDSVTEVNTVADRREATERMRNIRQQLRTAAQIARRKQQRLYA